VATWVACDVRHSDTWCNRCYKEIAANRCIVEHYTVFESELPYSRRKAVPGVTLTPLVGVVSVIRLEDSHSHPPPTEEDIFFQRPIVRDVSCGARLTLFSTVHECDLETDAGEELMSDEGSSESTLHNARP
jgi:hypothetical protein